MLGTPATAGFAQSASSNAQLTARINQLENQIQTLSRTVYRGKTPPAATSGVIETVPLGSGGGGSAGVYADLESRLVQIERQQRDLTGQLERMNYDLQQMKERLDKTLADNEMRFQQVEGGGARPSMAPPVNTAAPAYSTTPEVTGDLYADERVPSTMRTLGTLTAPVNSAEGLYESAFADVRDSRYAEAETKFKKFMSTYSTHPLAANAQYWLAETYYVRGDYRQSAKSFAQGYQDHPQGPKAADSLLKLGLSLSKLGKKDDACLSFQQLKKEFPGSETPASRRADQEMKQLGC